MPDDFDLSPYAKRIEESRHRLDLAARFQEPDRVPISMSVAGPFFCSLFGVNIRDYYTDEEVCLEVQLKGARWCFEELQDDRTGYPLHLDLGPTQEAIVFGNEIYYPDHTSPWIIRKIGNPDEMRALEVPDFKASPLLEKAVKRWENMKRIAAKRGINQPIGFGLGIHPPISCACALVEPQLIYELTHTDPGLLHHFLRKCLDTYFAVAEHNIRVFGGGRSPTGWGLADDNSAFLSSKMYMEFVYPYNIQIYNRYGKEGRSLHFDGPGNHLFKILADEVKLTRMDIGGWSDVEPAKEAFRGKVFFHGGFNTKELFGDLEVAKPSIERNVRIGAPGGGYAFGVGGETYVGTNPQTLIAAVEYVKQIGTYPLRL